MECIAVTLRRVPAFVVLPPQVLTRRLLVVSRLPFLTGETTASQMPLHYPYVLHESNPYTFLGDSCTINI